MNWCYCSRQKALCIEIQNLTPILSASPLWMEKNASSTTYRYQKLCCRAFKTALAVTKAGLRHTRKQHKQPRLISQKTTLATMGSKWRRNRPLANPAQARRPIDIRIVFILQRWVVKTEKQQEKAKKWEYDAVHYFSHIFCLVDVRRKVHVSHRCSLRDNQRDAKGTVWVFSGAGWTEGNFLGMGNSFFRLKSDLIFMLNQLPTTHETDILRRAWKLEISRLLRQNQIRTTIRKKALNTFGTPQ